MTRGCGVKQLYTALYRVSWKGLGFPLIRVTFFWGGPFNKHYSSFRFSIKLMRVSPKNLNHERQLSSILVGDTMVPNMERLYPPFGV